MQMSTSEIRAQQLLTEMWARVVKDKFREYLRSTQIKYPLDDATREGLSKKLEDLSVLNDEGKKAILEKFGPLALEGYEEGEDLDDADVATFSGELLQIDEKYFKERLQE